MSCPLEYNSRIRLYIEEDQKERERNRDNEESIVIEVSNHNFGTRITNPDIKFLFRSLSFLAVAKSFATLIDF